MAESSIKQREEKQVSAFPSSPPNGDCSTEHLTAWSPGWSHAASTAAEVKTSAPPRTWRGSTGPHSALFLPITASVLPHRWGNGRDFCLTVGPARIRP